jgi:Sugar-transfer associated ATP-grasp
MQILTHKPKGRRFDFRRATVWAAELRKVPAWRIALEVVLLARGRGRLTSDDYFLQGAWRPGLTWAERREFIGTKANSALNMALNPPLTQAVRQITVDKLAATRRFQAAGLPVPAIYAVAAEIDPGEGMRWLGSADAITAFLRTPAALPAFGKPIHGSTGIGAARLDELTADGALRLGDGRTVTPEALAAEIWDRYRRGYQFQEIMHPHPDLARLIGPVIGTLRVLTIDAGQGPEVLYTALKAPAVGAMVDSAAGPLGEYAAVETATGRILRVQDRRQLGGLDTAVNSVSGIGIAGAILPDFAKALEIAKAAHASIGDRGLLGVDIMLTGEGPRLMEVNTSPFHSSYQTAFARGVLNPDLLPRLEAVRARFRAVTPRPKNCPLQ